MILACNCKHEYQDQRYGPGQRVHNKCGRERTERRCRCTVCGKARDIPRARTGDAG